MFARNSSRRPSTLALIVVSEFCGGLHFYLPVFVLYLQQRGLSLFDVNLLQAVALAALFIAEVPTGVLGDRFGRRNSVAIGFALLGISEFSMLFATQLWQFLALQVVLGFGFAFISGSQTAMLIDSLPEARHKRALGLTSAAKQIGFTISFLISGLFFPDTALQRFFVPILLTASVLGLAALTTSLIREPRAVHSDAQDAPPKPPASMRKLLHDSLGLLRNNGALRHIIALAILSEPFSWYWIALYQPYLQSAGVPEAWFGPALAAGSLLAAAVNARAEWIERSLPRGIGLLVLTLLPGAIYLAIAQITGLWPALLLFLFQHGTMNASRPLLSASQNAHINSENRATALSMLSLIATAYQVVIGVPLGLLATWSLPVMFACMGGMVIVGAVVFRLRTPALHSARSD
jgi:MFS family permease